jgi:hypothetical protein
MLLLICIFLLVKSYIAPLWILKKAFDTVWQTGLWRKLQNCEIKGKCFKITYNMYNDIKSCVQYNGSQSELFPCLTVVRQEENLSSLSFFYIFK